MNTKIVDDDEELLLLRIKALKSTPRVNISVQFTSDSDNDLRVIDIKKKKRHERKNRNSDNRGKVHEPNCSSNIDNNEDDDVTKLRQIALSSRRRSTRQSSNTVFLESKYENQPTIHISHDVAPVVSDSDSCQQVFISSGVVTETNIQESSAIQHDLISSTSEDHGIEPICAQSTASVIVPTCTLSMLTDNVKFTSSQSAFNSHCSIPSKASYSQSISSPLTSDQSSINVKSIHFDKQFKTEVVHKSSINDLNDSNQSDEKTLVHNKESHEKLFTNKESSNENCTTHNEKSHDINDEVLHEKPPNYNKELHEKIIVQKEDSLKITLIHNEEVSEKPLPPNEESHEKLLTYNEELPANLLTHSEKYPSSASECEQGTPKSAHVEIVIERTYPSLALTQKFVPSELSEYSPSSPSESEEDDSCNPELCNTDAFDDVLSLCTSDKDENELDSISLGCDSYTQATVKVTHTDTSLINRYINIRHKGKPKIKHTPPVLTVTDESLVSTETSTVKHNTSIVTGASTETSDSTFPEKSGQKCQLDKEINMTCSAEKDVNSDACGLNIILDRYLNEVAANKKTSKGIDLNLYTDNEDEYVYSSDDIDNANRDQGLLSGKNPSILQSDANNFHDNNWVDCKPGPSGYMPTIIHGYGSDSDESLTDTTHLNGNKLINNGLLSAAETTTENNKTNNYSNEDIKNSLEEQNIHEEGKREDLKDVTCSICLGPFENRSFLNLCFHSFCYMCIIQWSELSRLCPLCKTKYISLIHSVNTDLDYETYEFPDELPEKESMPQRREFSETMDDGRRFRYRSTVVDHEAWMARRIERERLEQEYMASRQQRRIKRRLKWSATKDMRKAVYRKGLQVKEVKQRGNPKYRDISPTFFEENPALKHRLVPWLLRDLNVLLGNEDENIRFVMTLILNLISKLPMEEDVFNEQLRPFLFDQTDHFVAELVSFASSPYDIRGYDCNVKYSKPATDVEITLTSFPAIQISDGESPAENKEFNLLNEVFNADEAEQAPLGDDNLENIFPEVAHGDDAFENVSPVVPLCDNGFEDISPVDTSPANPDDDVVGDGNELGSVDEGATAALNTNEISIFVVDKDERKNISDDEESNSDDTCNEGVKRRQKEGKKEKKKKRKRKRRRLDSDKSHRKKKSGKKENAKKSGKVTKPGEISLLSNDPGGDFLLKGGKDSEYQEKDDAIDNDGEIIGEDTKAGVVSLKGNDLDKKESNNKKTDNKGKRKRAEQKRKRKHKKKYKHVKHVKHKRRRIKSSSSEQEDVDEKVSSKTNKHIEPTSRKKCDIEQTDVPLQKTDGHKNIIADEEEEKGKPGKKSLKRKSTSSGTENLPKRKKKEKIKNNSDVKGRRKKKDKKKKKKHKHRKSTETNTHVPPSSIETNTCLNENVDKELQSKIDHAINAIMITKGGNNSSDDEDEFLNSQEVQDLLSKYKYNDKLDLIKDGDDYKTRAEVVHELLLIEKAITRRKEKKKQKQINQTSKSVSVSGKTVESHNEGLSEKPNGELLIDKARKKAEREKSYKVLIKELQEIEGRINSCRSSLQVKPSDMIENNR